MSLELGWMSPKDAKRFVARAVEGGLLRPDGDDLVLSFSPHDEPLPRDFRLDPDADMGRPDPFMDWVQRVAQTTGDEVGEVLARVAARQESHFLDALTAVLCLAHEAGLEVGAT